MSNVQVSMKMSPKAAGALHMKSLKQAEQIAELEAKSEVLKYANEGLGFEITELEKENASLNDQNKRVCTEVAELEKENILLKRVEEIFNASPDLTFDCCKRLFEQEFEAHNLDQQAKGINELVAHLKVNTSYLMFTESTFREVESYYDFLLDQAKALKEGKKDEGFHFNDQDFQPEALKEPGL
jgi:hypothetical protein